MDPLPSSPARPSSPEPTLHAEVPACKSQAEETARTEHDHHDGTSERASCAESPDPTAEGDTTQRRSQKGIRQLAQKFNPSLTLENSGSVARDHLASERTFLAYVRTSLTIASMGVALVQLFTIAGDKNQQLTRYSRPLGATIIIVGLCTLFLGVARYFTVQYALVVGMFPVARVSTILVAVALCAIITSIFGILLATRD
ncbi:uncharacterized protein C8Q71DRAFT_717853 [Rhodofomes roseus]|uniref:DUF202 domain-containing protein n=1 Tax=Rhodofomes roseus TaxID=34475 RepID=A0ABQ8K043_9APHY|nr:uncharacterized protein C8Q71DRAFT_717853 [Rhodofomes roseus]KAH9829707.1 hypothetical protein C8Q71DRAFT_717853 [Rhodofomes roseus]